MKKRKPKDAIARMLPPDNTIEMAEEGSSGETVTQTRLRNFYELEQEYMTVRQKYLIAYMAIQDLILHGASVHPGAFKVRPRQWLVRRPHYKQALIDAKGEDYQQRVLDATAPHMHFRVRIGSFVPNQKD